MTDWQQVGEGEDPEFGRRKLFLASVKHLSGWPSVVNGQEINAIFVATESEPDNEDVSALAEHLIKHGVFYVSCWGAGCECAHDLSDEVAVWLDIEAGREPAGAVVMTTWHDRETLGEALDFFWISARPDAAKAWGPAYLALSVGSSEFHNALVSAAAAL